MNFGLNCGSDMVFFRMVRIDLSKFLELFDIGDVPTTSAPVMLSLADTIKAAVKHLIEGVIALSTNHDEVFGGVFSLLELVDLKDVRESQKPRANQLEISDGWKHGLLQSNACVVANQVNQSC